MKNFYLFFFVCLFCTATISAQTWQIGSPTAADVTATLSGGTLTISGTGKMKDFNPAPWASLRKSITAVIINEGVTSIGEDAFYSFENLTSVIIPASVESIGYLAFSESGLQSVTILGNSLKMIGDWSFDCCFSLTTINIPESVEIIDEGAFHYCESLPSVTIPASVTFIGDLAFYYCSAMTSIDVDPNNETYSSDDGILYNKDKTKLIACPSGKQGNYTIHTSTETIEFRAFEDSKLTSIIIPASVKDIGYAAFISSLLLTAIEVDPNNTEFTSEGGVLYNKNKTTLVVFPAQNSSNYTIPASVEVLGSGAFWGSDIQSVTISENTLKTIGNYCFQECKNLTYINLPASVEYIGVSAFWDCNINSIVLGDKLKTISSYAFSGCKNLTEIVNFNPKPLKISDVFSGINKNTCVLRVPAASVDNYKQTAVWKELNIVALEDDISMKLDKREIYLLSGATSTLTAKVTGKENDFDYVLWENSAAEVASVEYACTTAITTPGSETGLGGELLHECEGMITALRPGSTVISVFLFGIKDSCMVTVIQRGNSTIKGTVDNAGTSSVRVNLYMKPPESDTKKGIIGGYVLLATTVPNSNGEYKFENLPEGSYKVDVEIDDYESESLPEINISDNETRSNINFEVDGTTGTVIPKIVTGTVETWHAASLQIHPNPFTDVVHIVGAYRNTPVHIFNTAGAIVHTQIIANPEETIHLGHLPAGMYIIRLENGKTIKAIKIQ